MDSESGLRPTRVYEFIMRQYRRTKDSRFVGRSVGNFQGKGAL